MNERVSGGEGSLEEQMLDCVVWVNYIEFVVFEVESRLFLGWKGIYLVGDFELAEIEFDISVFFLWVNRDYGVDF